MDFVTYHFDSPAQFYSELKDLVEEGGFHDSPESQVNTFISLIIRYQDSNLFQNNTFNISNAIIDRAIQSQTEQDICIIYHILLYAGMEFPKVYQWMLKSEFVAKLKYQILQMEALVDEDFLHYLLDLVERTRTDADEGLNYGVVKLLLAFNEQYMLHQAACRAASNYTPSNPLLVVLADRPGASCTFGENLIFMLNRAEEASLQTMILKLLYLFFTSRSNQLTHFFYTNDLLVLVDVVIRELWDLPEEQEPLRHAYLRVMGPLLTNTQLRQERASYKRAEILKVLGELGGDDLDEALRRLVWEQEMAELQLQQKELQNRLLTYRDRQSSNSVTSSPALANRLLCNLGQGGNSNAASGTATSLAEKRRSARSIVLENVLPPSRSNSSTNLHVHMSTPPPQPPHSAPAMRERRDSQPPRAVSPTTQRLVERVLREWLLQNEVKDDSASRLAEDRRIAIPVAQ
ncbi:hypothetical protein BGZ99_009928 [Dissophora globulifera]|uniref:SPIN90/Ldb17 leucine-rich domain-containing protein n=1 Tax=Dissophora globulifera TaxID=979702 RepID=A0A9P6R392_9FUNG|nr:hypothetical protein BGZ99_009928 [Dissophora globulifera]